MDGFKYFSNVFCLLSEDTKKEILEKIFSIKNIVEYYSFFNDSKLFFRIYANCTFYQFVFIFGNVDVIQCFRKNEMGRVVCYYIYVSDDFKNDISYFFSYFMLILLSSSELEVYKIFPIFLWWVFVCILLVLVLYLLVDNRLMLF